ncbi:MAG: hypothetical protein D6819_05580 [Gammaproteobacteria bacterium]|nr:MAG: hypothetical protein D6819_05580 [Gammaproteobacteria bacterium]
MTERERRRRTISTGRAIEELVRQKPRGMTVSGAINLAVERYFILAGECALPLDEAEKEVLRRLLRKYGSGTEDLKRLPERLARDLERRRVHRNIKAARRLLERLRRASLAELVATAGSVGF